MSLTKAAFRQLRDLAKKKTRKETDEFIVEGFRLVGEALNSDFPMQGIYYASSVLDDPDGEKLIALARKKAPVVEQISAHELEGLTDTVTAQGILGVLKMKVHDVESLFVPEQAESILVALDAVSDPGNLGSIIRTCDWFGVQGLLLGKRSVEPYNPKVIRSTMGSIFHLPVVPDVELLSALSHARSAGYTIYVTDLEGEKHFDRIRFDRKAVIVFGNEAWGASDQVKELADVHVAIRRYGQAESLNVGVACGVVLSALHRLYDE
jgi:RNA methyltransferase, TrmH family